uniref:NADH-ubiquinone oxidoreductase chain 2 n=1 Tax=Oryzaephilus surinamensis TaxID=41112 RepID=A0A8A6NLG6_ORYSU|nr:NADH dehydrogenase subunit 2 [Oryzaephilus surinamensis]
MTKNYKILFLIILIFSTLLSISSPSWFVMWISLEINLLSIIPLMSNQNNIYQAESSMKYFIVQTIASSILLFSLIIKDQPINNELLSMQSLMFTSSLMMKMGMAPFHFWLPEVMEGLTWENCLILATWQKIAPSCLLMYEINLNLLTILIILSSSMISSLMSLKQTSMRKIMAYSSINHMAWMLSSMSISSHLWIIYFLIYSLTNVLLMMTFKILNINKITQMFNPNFNKSLSKFLFSMNLLSMGGLPPFIGFMPKWFTTMSMSSTMLFMLILTMIIFTLIMLYVYMRLGFPSQMFKNKKTSLKFKIKLMTWMPTLNFILITGLTILPSFTYLI